MEKNKNVVFYDDPDTFINFVKTKFIKTDVVLDIGAGIYPFNHINFVPKLQMIIEPYSEYIDVLKANFDNDSYVLIFKADALTVLKLLAENSVDTVFLIDVIEHMSKETGMELITELNRVTKQQIIIFTPLGFMPQHVNTDKKDRWGLTGGQFQEHLSGWTPEDFSDKFDFYVCKEFHKFEDDGRQLDEIFGAFFAIQNMAKSDVIPRINEKYFRSTPKDLLIKEQQNTIYRMQTSYSWKITSPFRVLKWYTIKKWIGFKKITHNLVHQN